MKNYYKNQKKNRLSYKKKLIKIIDKNLNKYKIEFLDDYFLDKFPRHLSVECEGNVSLNEGDIIKAKFKKINNNHVKMHSVILIEKSPLTFFGILKKENEQIIIEVSNKFLHQKFSILDQKYYSNFLGSFVKAREVKNSSKEVRIAKIIKIVTEFNNKDLYLNDLAINQYQLKRDFPKSVLEETEKIKKFKKVEFYKSHKDLSDLSFVTIDPKDAKDHDDAIFVLKDKEKNKNGFTIFVSIADVSFYVKENSFIDKEAFVRGNSTYLPGEVIPMLPKKLSNDLCSLKKNCLRPCITLKMKIDKEGKVTKYEIFRSIIKVKISFTYEEINEIIEGKKKIKKFSTVVNDIYKAYKTILKQKILRDPLKLLSEEIQIEFDKKNNIENIFVKENLEAHKIIEEFMILANSCIAKQLSEINSEIIYRIHENPDSEKIRNLRKLLKSLKINSSNFNFTDSFDFNKIIENQNNYKIKQIIQKFFLKSMKQAKYSTKNIGHFGLNLKQYVHFTSPIRRYSDLKIHRILINNLKIKNNKPTTVYDFNFLCSQISYKERVSAKAEKETSDRYIAKFLKRKIGNEFYGYISDIKKNGILVKLIHFPSESFIHKKELFFYDLLYDSNKFCLKSTNNRVVYNLGDKLKIKLIESFPLSGSLVFKILEHKNRVL